MTVEKPEKELEDRRSRFIWQPGDIQIIKPVDEVSSVDHDQANPASDPAEPQPKKDNDQQDG